MAMRRRSVSPANPLGISQTTLTLIHEADEQELTTAVDAGTVGFMARMMVQVTMPHSMPTSDRFVRTNGRFTIQMVAGDLGFGLPYGSIPRLVLAWMTTEAVRTKSRELDLGRSFSAFVRAVGLIPQGANVSGGKRGVGKIALRQTLALLKAIVTWSDAEDARHRGKNIVIADDYDLAWDPSHVDDLTLWKSTVSLSEKFFQEITAAPVPLDLRALKALKRSPMRLDIYSWLTWRMFSVKRPTQIPWEYLKAQFGAGYAEDAQGLRDFKKAFLEALQAVQLFYREAKVVPTAGALSLRPSPTHVLRS